MRLRTSIRSIRYLAAVALVALDVGCGDDGAQDTDPPSGGSSSVAGSQGGDGSGSGGAGSHASGSGGGGSGQTAGSGDSGRGGGGDSGSGDSGTGDSGSGDSGTGDSGSGGAGSGDSGTGGTSEPSVVGNHCSPGTVYYVGGQLPSFSAVESGCEDRDANGDGEEDHVNSILLNEPMRLGESYAFSVLWDTGWVVLELYGTDEDCGEPQELLASGRIEQDEIGCFTMNPTMAHPRLLLVWAEGGGAQDDLAICPMGSCEP